MRNNASLAAEIVFLRKQLAMFVERGARPRRASNGERLAMIALSGLFVWREALVVVRPATLIGWHRRAFRLFWSWKSRPSGRPLVPRELRALIQQLVRENPTWGANTGPGELAPRRVAVSIRAGLPSCAITPGPLWPVTSSLWFL